jgi:hypothetical protein
MTVQVSCKVVGEGSVARVLGVFDRTEQRCKACVDFPACLEYCDQMTGPSEPPGLPLALFNDLGGAGPEITEVYCRHAGKDLSIRDASERFYGGDCDTREPGCLARFACKEVNEQYLHSSVVMQSLPHGH